jgi:hypothetical protein
MSSSRSVISRSSCSGCSHRAVSFAATDTAWASHPAFVCYTHPLSTMQWDGSSLGRQSGNAMLNVVHPFASGLRASAALREQPHGNKNEVDDVRVTNAHPSDCTKLCRLWCSHPCRTGSSASRCNSGKASRCRAVAGRCIPALLSNRSAAQLRVNIGPAFAFHELLPDSDGIPHGPSDKWRLGSNR